MNAEPLKRLPESEAAEPMVPAVDAVSDPLRRKFDRARRLIADDLVLVNEQIITRLQSEVSLIPQLAQHLVAAGGKRIRPMLTLLAAQLCGYQGKRQIGLAAVVEFIHTATLLHDDVVDESDLRRGESSANAIFGNKAPVLVGDFLFSRAFQMMVADGSLRTLEILSNASAIIAEGEVAQLVTSNDLSTDEAAYLNVIEAKTAALFEAACQIGAVVADRPMAEESALAVYGRNLGVAFQLVDDALDYSAKQAHLGKEIGDDFREGKITLPVIIAYAKGNADEKAFWVRTLERVDQAANDLDSAMALIDRHNAIDETIARARDYGYKAQQALSVFPISQVRRSMEDLVDFSIHRAH